VTLPSSNQPSPAGGLASAEQLCSLLTAEDWGAFGFVTGAQPEINDEGPGTANCVFAGQSGATGGLELDAYVHDTVAEAEDTLEIIREGMPNAQPITLPGADEALIDPDVDASYGAIVVRNGRFTYTISLPGSEQAQAQLTALAAAVLARSQQYR